MAPRRPPDRHVPTLAHLISLGALRGYVRVTTSELGRRMSRSQQSASDHLRELEREGLVRRAVRGRALSVLVTPAGRAAVARMHEELRACLESAPPALDLSGAIVSGSGEGRYYMSLRGYTRQFQARVGYVPFPGTLNVRLDGASAEAASRLDSARGTVIDGFSDGERTYGWVRCHAATLNGRVACEIIRLERTHHGPSIVELVAPVSLRRRLRASDGSRVSISVAA